MAFLLITKSKNIDYYTIAESYRDNDGRVKRRRLEYIGNFDALKDYVVKGYQAMQQLKTTNSETESDKPPPQNVNSNVKLLNVKTYTHGSCMALLAVAELLGLEQLINSEIDDHKTIKGHTRGKLLVLAAIHRVLKPGSKRAFSRWASTTSLPYYAHFAPKDLTSQSFWEAMDGISVPVLERIWHHIVEDIFHLFGIKILVFHLDYTNYFTFIDSNNQRCLICKRGHNKQKRDDLRQFSLAVLTAFAMQIPIIWQVYDGNKNDKVEFADFIKEITTQLKALDITLEEVTICFDGGSNSEENFSNLPFHIVCAHSMVSFQYLYDIDIDCYKDVELENGKRRKAYRIDNICFSGITGTGILIISETLKLGQINGLDTKIESAIEICKDIQSRLKNPRSKLFTLLKKAKTSLEHERRDAIEYNAAIDAEEKEHITSGTKRKGRRKKKKSVPEWNEKDALLEIIAKEVYAGRSELREFTMLWLFQLDDGSYSLSFICIPSAKELYIRKYYGKKMICTDHTDWTTERILMEYGGQECIENGVFKISKDREYFTFQPQYHWTDEKIIVHTFCCLLGLTMTEVLEKLMIANDVNIISEQHMLNTLSGIRDGWGIIEQDQRLLPQRFLEEMTPEQKKMWDVVESIQTMSMIEEDKLGA